MRSAALVRARECLVGLSVGDALGESFFGPHADVERRIRDRSLPDGTRRWTDDTAMASSLVRVLVDGGGRVDPVRLIGHFAADFDVSRGYGHLTRDLLWEVRHGADPRPLVAGAHGGSGSWGNGAAMRVAPVGAWFAGDPQAAADCARNQAAVTHGHPEAAEGAVAVAVAAAIAAGSRGADAPGRARLLADTASWCRPGQVRSGLERAASLTDITVQDAVSILGNGREISAADTVPFALWSASGHLDSFTEGFWATVEGLGDRDTTCAMACGVIAARVGLAGIPQRWQDLTEPLPWFVRC